MSRAQRIAINWLGTTLTWISAPVGGGAAAIFLLGGFLWLVGMLVGTARTPTLEALQFGALGAAWCAAVWYVFFLHKSIWSRVIHFAGCTLGAIVGLPFAGIFLGGSG